MHSNLSYLSKLKPKKIVIIKNEFNEHTIGFVCLILLPTTTGQHGNRTRLLSKTDELKQSALTTRLQRLYAKRNSGNYIDRQSNGVVLRLKILNEL